MAIKHIVKRVRSYTFGQADVRKSIEEKIEKQEKAIEVVEPKEAKAPAARLTVAKNKKEKKDDVMNNEQINRAESILQNMESAAPRIKVVKQDKGLIERTESSKIILTEDNRQILND